MTEQRSFLQKRYNYEVIVAVRFYIESKPWDGTREEQIEKMRSMLARISSHYQKPFIGLQASDTETDCQSRIEITTGGGENFHANVLQDGELVIAHITPSRTIYLEGKFSVLAILLAYGQHTFNTVKGTRWALGLYRRFFPNTWEDNFGTAFDATPSGLLEDESRGFPSVETFEREIECSVLVSLATLFDDPDKSGLTVVSGHSRLLAALHSYGPAHEICVDVIRREEGVGSFNATIGEIVGGIDAEAKYVIRPHDNPDITCTIGTEALINQWAEDRRFEKVATETGGFYTGDPDDCYFTDPSDNDRRYNVMPHTGTERVWKVFRDKKTLVYTGTKDDVYKWANLNDLPYVSDHTLEFDAYFRNNVGEVYHAVCFHDINDV